MLDYPPLGGASLRQDPSSTELEAVADKPRDTLLHV